MKTFEQAKREKLIKQAHELIREAEKCIDIIIEAAINHKKAA